METAATSPALAFGKWVDEETSAHGFVLLDGGLASTLEKRGLDLSTKLWSAAVLHSAPHRIAAVHRDFVKAGARVCITSTYQASDKGFIEAGIARSVGHSLMHKSVALAVAATTSTDEAKSDTQVKVAASIGPYGAVLADGSEYSGIYTISDEELFEFHHSRLKVISKAPGIDVLACETMPCAREARVLAKVIRTHYPDLPVWFSFSCKSGSRLHSGDSLVEAVEMLEAALPGQLVAVGVNCVHPRIVADAIAEINSVRAVPAAGSGYKRRIIVYPNRGELWNAKTKSWEIDPSETGTPDEAAFLDLVRQWVKAGVVMVGGCCRMGPEVIAAMKALQAEPSKVEQESAEPSHSKT